MLFIFELCDDKEYTWYIRHKVFRIHAGSYDRAWKRVRELYPIDDWYVAQVSRPFDDCACAQPVFDAFNGNMFSDNEVDTARTWAEIQRVSAERREALGI